jgi:hypothetical protein
MKGGRGFGMIMLLMVLAVVLYMVARNWEAFGPAAVQVKNHKGKPILDAHGQEDAAAEVRSRNVPDLDDMQNEVQKHNSESSETMGAMDALRDSK